MPPQPTRQQQCKKCSVPLPFEPLAIWRLPKRVSLLCRQPVSKANTQFLHTFDAVNASREIRTEQAAIGRFVREPPHSAQAQVDSSWSQLQGFQIVPVPYDHDPIECQTVLRAIPINELVDGMTIPALGVGTGQAIQDCCLGMFKIGKAQDSLGFIAIDSG